MCLRGGGCFLSSTVYVKSLTLERNPVSCSMQSSPLCAPPNPTVALDSVFAQWPGVFTSFILFHFILPTTLRKTNLIIILQMKNLSKAKVNQSDVAEKLMAPGGKPRLSRWLSGLCCSHRDVCGGGQQVQGPGGDLV